MDAAYKKPRNDKYSYMAIYYNTFNCCFWSMKDTVYPVTAN